MQKQILTIVVVALGSAGPLNSCAAKSEIAHTRLTLQDLQNATGTKQVADLRLLQAAEAQRRIRTGILSRQAEQERNRLMRQRAMKLGPRSSDQNPPPSRQTK